MKRVIIVIFQTTTIFVIRILCLIFTGFKVEGKQFLETINGPVIFIVNHRSMFDPFLAGSAPPNKWLVKILPYRFMTAERFMKMLSIKVFMMLWGCYPVAPGSGALEEVLKPSLAILKDPRQSLLMFPEGKIIYPGMESRVRPGIAYLAKKSKRLIVPIGIIGSKELTWLKFFTGQNKLIVKFGQPFYYHEIAGEDDDLNAAAIKIFSRVKKLLPENY